MGPYGRFLQEDSLVLCCRSEGGIGDQDMRECSDRDAADEDEEEDEGPEGDGCEEAAFHSLRHVKPLCPGGLQGAGRSRGCSCSWRRPAIAPVWLQPSAGTFFVRECAESAFRPPAWHVCVLLLQSTIANCMNACVVG